MNRNLYVVEGKMDIDKLKSIGVRYVIKTNGYNLKNQMIEFLKLAQEKRKIILLLDPDGAGKMIAKMISSVLTNAVQVNVSKQMSIKNGKVGIAETDSKYLKGILKDFLEFDSNANEVDSISKQQIIELGLTGPESKAKKDTMQKEYFLNISSGKTLYRDLNILRVTNEMLEKVIYGK